MPGSGFSSSDLKISLKRLLFAGDHTLAFEFLLIVRLFRFKTYGIVETGYFPSLSIPIVLYWPGPGTDCFLAISTGSKTNKKSL